LNSKIAFNNLIHKYKLLFSSDITIAQKDLKHFPEIFSGT